MQVVKAPAHILTKKAKPVTKFDKNLKKLVNEMIKTLAAARNPEGVGLAAPQVGILKRIFVMQLNPNSKKSKRNYKAFINPKIIKQESVVRPEESNTSKILEGCLSIDNVWGFPSRASWVKIRYQDLSSKKFTQKFEGFPAHIIQHEIDHLNGILFTHRVLEQKGELYKIQKDRQTKKPILVPLEI